MNEHLVLFEPSLKLVSIDLKFGFEAVELKETHVLQLGTTQIF